MHPLTWLALCEKAYSAPTMVSDDGRDAFYSEVIDGTNVVAFRGTLTEGLVGVRDWINDFDDVLVRRPDLPGRVHKGFLSSTMSLLPHIPIGNTLMTGHSKGGAMAFLAGYLRGCDVVTFGAPRVGDSDWAAGFNACRYGMRYENFHDVVPTLPILWYKHAGQRKISLPKYGQLGHLVLNHGLETGYKPWLTQPG